MKKIVLLISTLIGVATISLSSCDIFDLVIVSSNSESENVDSFLNSHDSLDPNTNYYYGGIEDTYYSVNQKGPYGKFLPKSSGEAKILVIPVKIKGYEKNASKDNKNRIEKTFFGESKDTAWESVASYYYKSSFNKLKISGAVTDWFDIDLTPNEIYKKQESGSSDGGTFYVLNKAIEWAKNNGINTCDYDLNKDGYIDSIWLIYSCPNYTNDKNIANVTNENDNPFWAFTYWDYTNTGKGNKNDPVPNTYAWASYDFMNNMSTFPSLSVNDAHTYIHEQGHMFGLDDYYDTSSLHSPMGGIDMMDYNVGDHTSFSKYALGWINPYVVKGPTTIELKPAVNSGDCIIVKSPKSSFNNSAFDEYLMIELITQDGLWAKDSTIKYMNSIKAFTEPGIRITHVDARLALFDSSNLTYVSNSSGKGRVYVPHSNTPKRSASSGNTELREDLINIIPKDNNNKYQKSKDAVAGNSILFKSGDTFKMDNYSAFFNDLRMHDGTYIPYTISFSDVTSESATVTFSL